MAFTPEQKREIIRVFTSKTLANAPCLMCGTNNWILNDGLVFFHLQTPQELQLGVRGPALPNLAISCSTCGNTMFFNVFTLGLGNLLGLIPRTTEGSGING